LQGGAALQFAEKLNMRRSAPKGAFHFKAEAMP
jgi:hypothetical protein